MPASSMRAEDVHVNLFYFFPDPPEPAALQAAGSDLPLPDSLRSSLNQQSPLWTRQTMRLRDDFLPPVQALFSAKQDAGPAIGVWELSSQACRWLDGSARSLSLEIALTTAAKRRLQAGDGGTADVESPRLKIRSLHYYAFSTGFGVAVADVGLKNQTISRTLLLETVHSLTRFNTLVWRQAEEPDATEPGPDSSMGLLVRGLLNCAPQSKPHDRVFAHTCARLLDCPDDRHMADELALRLARHYTDDYQLGDDPGETVYLGDFHNVRHCVANEGTATLVMGAENDPEHVKDYFNKATKTAHLPILLMNFHAEQALQRFMENTGIWLTGRNAGGLADDAKTAARLEELARQRRLLVNFDLHFFYPVISRINIHNRLHRAIMKIKRLNEQHAIVSRNTRLISGLMISDQKTRERKAQNRLRLRYCRLAAWGAAAVAYLTVFSIAKEGLDVWLGEWGGKEEVPGFHHYQGTVSLAVALLVFLFVLYVSRRRCDLADREDEESHHPALEAAEMAHLHELVSHRTAKRRHS